MAQADADAEAEAAAWWKRQKLMDVYAGSTGIATVQASLSLSVCMCVFVCCLFVPHCAATQIFCYRNGRKLGPVGLGPLKWLR